MSTIDYSVKIPNNVDLSGDRTLQRALESWQPNFIKWWDDVGPEGSITPEAAAFLSENSSTTNRTSLAQVRAIVSGDLGFASPGAVQPIGFALSYQATREMVYDGDVPAGFGAAS